MKSLLIDHVGNPLTDVPKPSKLDYSISQLDHYPLIALYSPHGLCYQGFHDSPQAALLEYGRYIPWSIQLGAELAEKPQQQPLHVVGTDFQILVWTSLCKLAHGETFSYSQFAHLCQRPTAVRAIASAIARNPIAMHVPCHRIIPKRGGSGQYRWGSTIKQSLLRMESHQF